LEKLGGNMYDRVTASDIKKMEEEIEHRKLVVRKEALEAVKEARAHGDLSENFEYKAAKKFKNENEGRIRYLEKMIKTARVIEDEAKDDEMGLNKTARLLFKENGMTKTVTLVTTVLGNSRSGLISIESPIGAAILGHKVGDEVEVDMGGGRIFNIEIQSIKPFEGELELRKY
jgi:transcription elongation factor GreA